MATTAAHPNSFGQNSQTSNSPYHSGHLPYGNGEGNNYGPQNSLDYSPAPTQDGAHYTSGGNYQYSTAFSQATTSAQPTAQTADAAPQKELSASATLSKIAPEDFDPSRVIFDQRQEREVMGENNTPIKAVSYPIRYRYQVNGQQREGSLMVELSAGTKSGIFSYDNKPKEGTEPANKPASTKCPYLVSINMPRDDEKSQHFFTFEERLREAVAHLVLSQKSHFQMNKMTFEVALSKVGSLLWQKFDPDTMEEDETIDRKLYAPLFYFANKDKGPGKEYCSRFYLPVAHVNKNGEEIPVDWELLMKCAFEGKFLIKIRDVYFKGKESVKIRISLVSCVLTDLPRKVSPKGLQEDTMALVRNEKFEELRAKKAEWEQFVSEVREQRAEEEKASTAATGAVNSLEPEKLQQSQELN